MHRFTIAAASLIAATISMGGCEKKPNSQPDPEALATVAVPVPEPERTEYFTLLALCESGDATPERVQEFLDLRVDVNAKDEFGFTPLHSAAGNENPEVLTVLIEAGADVNAKNPVGQTPLHNAAGFNNPEVLTALIEAVADVNAKDESGQTPLHFAAEVNENPEVVTTLIKAGADVNAKNERGGTPLHWAAEWNENPEVLTVLIETGADVNAKTVNGLTPLDFVISPPSGFEPMPKNAELLRAAGGKRGGEESGTPTDLNFRRLIEIATNPTVSSPTGLRQRQDCHANSAEAHRR